MNASDSDDEFDFFEGADSPSVSNVGEPRLHNQSQLAINQSELGGNSEALDDSFGPADPVPPKRSKKTGGKRKKTPVRTPIKEELKEEEDDSMYKSSIMTRSALKRAKQLQEQLEQTNIRGDVDME